MTPLLSLPAEIHLQIIEESDVYDLEALWTSCKTFHVYGAKDLRANHRRKALYHTIVVGWDNDSQSQIHPLLDLRGFLEDEDVGFYPKVMKINSLSYGDLGNERCVNKKAGFDGIITKHGDRITKLVSEVHRKLLPNAPTGDAIAWNKDIQNGRPAATVILLLALCPHLESLHIHIPGQNWWNVQYGTLFSALTTAAMNPVTNTLGIYSRLSEFSLKGDKGVMRRPWGVGESDLELFRPFMALPTVRSIEARHVDVRAVWWPWERGFSQVNDVKLKSCDIDITTLHRHIYAVKALKRFTYTFYPSKELWAASNPHLKPRLQPGAILALLRNFACDTLAFLELTACTREISVPFQNDDPYIGSLRAFKVLEEVKLDTMVLYERSKPSANVALNLQGKFPRDRRQFATTQKLIDFLPSSIQTFHMTSSEAGKGLWRKEVDTMFKDLPELRPERLPNLKEICVEYKEKGNTLEKIGRRELRSRCKETNIKCQSIRWRKVQMADGDAEVCKTYRHYPSSP